MFFHPDVTVAADWEITINDKISQSELLKHSLPVKLALPASQPRLIWTHVGSFLSLYGDRKLHGSGLSDSPKFFFRARWRVGDARVGRGYAGWTISKSRHP